uniref:beta strand repeat-containing protein n=1 Tax=Treponema sp. TaxID=166 RepID=UPI00388F7E3D
MKKYGKIIKIAFAFLLQLFIFASCENLTDSSSAAFTSESSSKTGTTVILNGTVSAQGAFPQAVIDSLESSAETESRAAIPSVPDGAYYYLLATPDSGDTVSGDSKSGTFTVTEGTFALPLASGKTWNVEIGIKNSSDTVILNDSYSVALTEDDPVILHTFVLQASSGGTGSVSLSMNVSDTVTKVTSSCADSGWTNNIRTSQTYITGSSVPSGTYEVTLNFYSSLDILLYSTVQNISVLSGMETNYWKNSASSSASLISNGKLELTQALITSFARSTFYIGNTSVGTASSSGNGSPYEPFESLNQALSAIAVTGSPSNDYRIFVNGTLTGINEISSSVNGKAQSITVSGLTGNSTDILNGNSAGTVLTVSTTVPVTIRKLKITGGISENGGGLNIAAGADVTLGEGSLITGNSASGDGGGIYNKGTLTLSGGTISANEVTGASSAGGGVYNTKTFTMTGGTIGGSTASNANKASGSAALGGGVGNYGSSAIFTMQGGLISHNEAEKGGGVYGESSAAITIEDGTISGNSASAAGGGIYVSSLGNTDKIEIKGGTISSNTAGEGGAGIMAVSSNLKISGGTIQKNSAGANAGGGICFNGASNTLTISGGTIGGTSASEANTAGEGAGIYLTAGTLNITGGTISYNTATKAGGAIYLGSYNSPTMTMSGGTISSNSCTATTASIGYGGGGIYANKACTFTGGTISSNTTANSTGGAIYAAVSPSVGSSVSIPTGGSVGKNDIYLATSISVNITSEISSSSKILLTTNDYTVGKSVLTGSTSSSYTKFTLSNTSYRISSSGEIVEIVSSLSDLNTKIANLSDGGTLEVYVTSTLSVGSGGFSVPSGKTVVLIRDSSIS